VLLKAGTPHEKGGKEQDLPVHHLFERETEIRAGSPWFHWMCCNFVTLPDMSPIPTTVKSVLWVLTTSSRKCRLTDLHVPPAVTSIFLWS